MARIFLLGHMLVRLSLSRSDFYRDYVVSSRGISRRTSFDWISGAEEAAIGVNEGGPLCQNARGNAILSPFLPRHKTLWAKIRSIISSKILRRESREGNAVLASICFRELRFVLISTIIIPQPLNLHPSILQVEPCHQTLH